MAADNNDSGTSDGLILAHICIFQMMEVFGDDLSNAIDTSRYIQVTSSDELASHEDEFSTAQSIVDKFEFDADLVWDFDLLLLVHFPIFTNSHSGISDRL